MSHFGSPPLINDSHFYVSGNVIVHPNAVIAPSVMLQADPDSKLMIAAGVCVGVGCILHAHQGTLEIAAGATLGSGVLVVGRGTIGADACIGSMTTIFNSSVPAKQMIPPGSLIGDDSRSVVLVESSEPYPQPPQASSPAPSTQFSDAPPSTPTPSDMSSEQVKVVYGRTYIERMMVTMFPHRQNHEDS